jgi:hypothetical protein
LHTVPQWRSIRLAEFWTFMLLLRLSEASAHLSWNLAIAREAPASFLALQLQTPPAITSAYRKVLKAT